MTKIDQKIPEGWSVKKLGEITSFRSGGTPDKNKPEYWNGNIPWISASSMRGFVYKNSNEKISETGLNNGSNCVNKGDLLILVRGSMLWNCIPVGIADGLLAFNQDVKGISIKSDTKPFFLLYWFYTNEQKIKNMVVGTGIGAGKLETDELKNLDIPLPPLPEQEKIAEILGCWDDGIEKLSRLIEQKKLLKKGLMQRLLSGKQRLSGFLESWKKFEFEQIALLNNKKYIPNQNEHLKCLELEHFEKETGRLVGHIDSAEQSSTKNIFKSGNVLFGKLRPYLKKFTRPFFDGVCSTEIWVLNGSNYCTNDYLYFLIQSTKFLSICNISSGTHMPRADWNFISHIPFFIPSLSEQKAIAGILSKADEEIDLLTSKLSALKSQKKGLMQKLLTGQIRVKVA